MLSESSKGNPRLCGVYAKGVGEFLDELAEQYGDRDRAAAALSCLVGARVISSAVELADRELADLFRSAVNGHEAQARVHASS
jgi:hypothetical protein